MTTFFFVLSTAKWQENSNSRLQSSLSLLSLLSLIKEYDDDDDDDDDDSTIVIQTEAKGAFSYMQYHFARKL